jgi:hypothetical protein
MVAAAINGSFYKVPRLYMLSQEQETLESNSEAVCASPSVQGIENVYDLFRIEKSHSWRLQNVRPFGEDGVLMIIQCINCGLERKSIHSDINDSAKRALL